MHLHISTFSVLAALTSSAVGQGSGQQEGNFTTGTLGNASVISNNPSGASYIATLPDTAFNQSVFPNGGNVKGTVQAVSIPNGRGVMFHVTFSNLPASGGPFIYHIHDQPVPANGSCAATLGHLDPYERGETTPCDPALPETCQVGDLAGKHGKINGTNVGDTYIHTFTDNFASTVDGIGAFFGNRSFVFHLADKTRVTCANFEPVQANASACDAPTTTTSGTTSTATATGTGHRNTTSTLSTTFATAAAQTNVAKAIAAVGAAGFAILM